MLGFRPILGLVDTASHAERPASSKARCALSQRLRIYLFQAHAHHSALRSAGSPSSCPLTALVGVGPIRSKAEAG